MSNKRRNLHVTIAIICFSMIPLLAIFTFINYGNVQYIVVLTALIVLVTFTGILFWIASLKGVRK